MRQRKQKGDGVKTGKTGNSNPRLLFPLQEEEMFRLDIYSKTQEALNLMFDGGHFCFFPTSSLSSSHTFKKKSHKHTHRSHSVCLFLHVCRQLHLLRYTRSHHCSLSRPGLIVSHLTAPQLCTKPAAVGRGCRGSRKHWRIGRKIENLGKKYKVEKAAQTMSPVWTLDESLHCFCWIFERISFVCWISWIYFRKKVSSSVDEGHRGILPQWDLEAIPLAFHCSSTIKHLSMAAHQRRAEKCAGVLNF